MDRKVDMTTARFHELSDELLHKIIDKVEDQDPTGLISCDLYENVVSMVTPRGQYLINRNADVQEVWLSSPISGPAHFAHRGGRWLSSQHEDLLDTLEKELSSILSKDIKF